MTETQARQQKQQAQPVLPSRLPPCDIEAEEAVIASMLIPEGAQYLPALASKLRGDDFFREANAWVFAAALDVWQRHEEPNVITVAHQLAKGGENRLEQVGGMTFLNDIIRRLPAVSGALWYADIVVREAQKRTIISAAQTVLNQAWSHEHEPDAIIADAVEAMLGLASRSSKSLSQNAGEIVDTVLVELADWLEDPTALRGVPTGWGRLDAMTRGLQRGKVYTAMGDTSIGKSFLVHFLAWCLTRSGYPVGIFSSEMTRAEIIERLIFMEAGVDPLRIGAHGTVTPAMRDRILDASDRVRALTTLHICDLSRPPITTIVAEARRWRAQYGVVGVFVDHLQHVTVPGKDDPRAIIEEATGAIKALAQNHDMWVWQISHINRKSSGDGEVTLHSGKNASSIEQDSDMVFTLDAVAPNGNPENGEWRVLNEQQASVYQANHSNSHQYVRLRTAKGRAGGKSWDVRRLDWATGGRWLALRGSDDYIAEQG